MQITSVTHIILLCSNVQVRKISLVSLTNLGDVVFEKLMVKVFLKQFGFTMSSKLTSSPDKSPVHKRGENSYIYFRKIKEKADNYC